MNTSRWIVLGMSGGLLLGSAVAQAEDLDTTVNQRNQVWSMQGAQDGSYTGTPVQTRIREQKQLRTRARVHAGDGTGSRYGRGYESRIETGSYGPGAGTGGSGRAGGQGGGRR